MWTPTAKLFTFLSTTSKKEVTLEGELLSLRVSLCVKTPMLRTRKCVRCKQWMRAASPSKYQQKKKTKTQQHSIMGCNRLQMTNQSGLQTLLERSKHYFRNFFLNKLSKHWPVNQGNIQTAPHSNSGPACSTETITWTELQSKQDIAKVIRRIPFPRKGITHTSVSHWNCGKTNCNSRPRGVNYATDMYV